MTLQALPENLRTYLDKKSVSRETIEKFLQYERLLKKWKDTAALVQETTLDNFFYRHILDSIQLADCIQHDQRILDIGTGAGFPGMVLAILGYSNITMVEANTKKTIFLEELGRQLHITPTIIINKRVEFVTGDYDVFTARAFSSLTNLIKIMYTVSRETNHQSKGIFLKGASHEAEIKEARENWDFDCEKIPSITEEDSRIIIVKNIKKKE